MGIYGKVTSANKGRKLKWELTVPAFDNWKYSVDSDWIEDYGLNFELPTLGIFYISSNALV